MRARDHSATPILYFALLLVLVVVVRIICHPRPPRREAAADLLR